MRSADERLKKNIGKTRFFFIDVARIASDAGNKAGAGCASSPVRTA
jgi:hypothetical protein